MKTIMSVGASAPALLCVALLSGCATTNGVLAKEPEEILHSTRSPAEIADCFAAKNLRLIERENGALVLRFRNGYGGIVRTFSIYPEGTGSRIEKRSSGPGVPGMTWKKCMGFKGAMLTPASPALTR